MGCYVQILDSSLPSLNVMSCKSCLHNHGGWSQIERLMNKWPHLPKHCLSSQPKTYTYSSIVYTQTWESSSCFEGSASKGNFTHIYFQPFSWMPLVCTRKGFIFLWIHLLHNASDRLLSHDCGSNSRVHYSSLGPKNNSLGSIRWWNIDLEIEMACN